MRRRSLACLLALVAVLGVSACVSRNVERIPAEEAATMPPPPEPLSAEERAAATAAVPGIDVAIRLADGVAAVPGGTVFVILRVAGREGGPPLAVKRLLPEFPQTARVTEEDAMIPGTPLVGDLEVTVRLDQDGNAFTQEPGDLVGRAGPVQAGAAVDVVLGPAEGTAGAP